jgi:hypothetical protein
MKGSLDDSDEALDLLRRIADNQALPAEDGPGDEASNAVGRHPKERFVRNLSPEDMLAKPEVRIGAQLSVLAQDEEGRTFWRGIFVTGLFYDGYAYLEL